MTPSIPTSVLHLLFVDTGEISCSDMVAEFASRSIGCRLSCADTLKTAQAYIDLDPPDIICVASTLPDGPGSTLLRSQTPIPVIFLVHPEELEQAESLLIPGTDILVRSSHMMQELPHRCMHLLQGYHLMNRGRTVRDCGEERIRISEERLAMSQQLGHTGSWEFHLQSGQIWGSAEGFRIYGFPPVDGLMDIEAIEACIPERERVHQAMVDLIQQGTPYDLTFSIMPADGSSPRTIRSLARLQTDTAGNPHRVIGVIIDITEQKQYEEELRKTNAYLESLIDVANVPIIVWDPTFHITRFNHAFEHLTGRSADEVLGQSLEVLFPPSRVERSMRLIRTTLDGVRWETVEIEIQHRDGSVRAVIWNSSTLYSADGQEPVATIAQGQDITDRRKLEHEREEAVRQINRNLAQLSILNDGIRNPLTVITLSLDSHIPAAVASRIIAQVHEIDTMANQLDQRWVESEKILNYLSLHYHLLPEVRQDHTSIVNSRNPVTQPACAESGVVQAKETSLLVEEIQAEFYTILESIDALVYVADMTTHDILFMNRRGRKVFGDVIGKKCFDSVQHVQQQPCAFCSTILEPGSDGSDVFRWEYYNQQNGRWYDCRARAIRWVNGRLARVEIATDITDRKETESALKESEEQYRTLADRVHDGIYIYTGDRFVFVNNRVSEITGYSKEELLGMKLWDLLHPEDRDRVLAISRDRLSGSPAPRTYESRIITNRGEIRYLELAVADIRYQGRLAALGAARDISDQKKVEAHLREREELLRTVVTNLSGVVFSVDREGVFLLSEGKSLGTLGLSPGEVVGRSVFEIFHDVPLIIDGMHEVLGGRPWTGTIKVRDTFFDTMVTPILDPEGGVCGGVGVATDVTERTRMEDTRVFLMRSDYLQSGEDFFHSLARYLAHTLKMDYICIDRLSRDLQTAQTVAVYYDGEFEPDITYAVEDTPCSTVIGERISIIAEGVARLYPSNGLLAELQAESYVGATLWGFDGKPIGLIAAIGRRSLTDTSLAASVIQLVAVRAAGELERTLSEQALRESEERYRVTVSAIPDALFVLDNKGVFLRCQVKDPAFLYRPEDQFIGRSVMDVLPDRVSHIVMDAILSVMDTGTAQERSYFLDLPDGRRWYEMRMVRITGNELLGMVRDITTRTMAEEALRESNQKLRLLTSLTRHDIFNQIAATGMFLDLADQAPDGEKSHEYLGHAREAVERIEAIIGFTREYERFSMVCGGWLNLAGIIRAATDEISFRDVSLAVDIPVDIEIYADPIIRKVFTTLMENAIRHGLSVTTIWMEVQQQGTDLIIICEDNGVGIEESEKERIFDHGYGRHTGIGLFLAREILSITGLSIRECGRPGAGARFEISVPSGKFRTVL